ncbi:MAG: glycogen-binding domain-containing protein [Spirochaetales bacterium]
MKRIFLLFFIATIFSSLFSLDLQQFEGKQFVLDSLLETIHQPQAPQVHGDYIIFTASPTARHTGIAFDFENYTVVHPFRRLVRQNEDRTNTESFVAFYILEIPGDIQNIAYRLVTDGLWTTDPENPNQLYDKRANLLVSTIELNRIIQPITTPTPQNTVRFVYEGESGQKIRLAGNFTNWDSFIYQLRETQVGLYELELPLPKGTYYYAYYIGLNSFTDDTNPMKAYTTDGRIASLLEVQ